MNTPGAALTLSALLLLAGTAFAQLPDLQGVVHPYRSLALRASVDSTVVELRVSMGDSVEAGQPIVQLDDRRLELEARRAAARLEAAESRLGRAELDRAIATVVMKRARRDAQDAEERRAGLGDELEGARQHEERVTALFEAGRGSSDDVAAARARTAGAHEAIAHARHDVDQCLEQIEIADLRLEDADLAIREARASVEERSTELELRRLQLSNSILVAPFGGIVGRVGIAVGDIVRGGETPLLELFDTSRVRVRVAIPAGAAADVRPGTPVLVSRGDADVSETLTALSGMIDENTGTMLAEIVIDNPERRWIPGHRVRVRLKPD